VVEVTSRLPEVMTCNVLPRLDFRDFVPSPSSSFTAGKELKLRIRAVGPIKVCSLRRRAGLYWMVFPRVPAPIPHQGLPNTPQVQMAQYFYCPCACREKQAHSHKNKGETLNAVTGINIH
jgi:hypothetical protein